jgi:hypothetical protein
MTPDPERSAAAKAVALVAGALGAATFLALFVLRAARRSGGEEGAFATPLAASAAVALFAALWLATDGVPPAQLARRWREDDPALRLRLPLVAMSVAAVGAILWAVAEAEDARSFYGVVAAVAALQIAAMTIVGRHLTRRRTWGPDSEREVMPLFRRAAVAVAAPLFAAVAALAAMAWNWWTPPWLQDGPSLMAYLTATAALVPIQFVVMTVGLAQAYPWWDALGRALDVCFARHSRYD